MTNDWLQKRLNDAKAQAGKRYSPELSVNVSAFSALEAFTHQDTWTEKTKRYLEELNENIQKWNTHVSNADDLPENSHQIIQNITEHIVLLNSILNEAVDPLPSTNVQTVSLQVSNLIENTIKIEEIFLNELLEALIQSNCWTENLA